MLTAEQKARLETLNSQLNSGKLTDAEISEWGGLYTHRDDSPHSAFRDAVYAPDAQEKPAEKQQTQTQTQQQTQAPAFNLQTYDAKNTAIASDEAKDKIVSDIRTLSASIDSAASDAFQAERRRLIDAGVNIDEANTTAKKLAEQSQSDTRKATYEKNEARLLSAIQALKIAEDTARTYASVYGCLDAPNPACFASLASLGSPERNSYTAQLQAAGPAALKAAAELARATKNHALAAAVFTLNGAYPKEQRMASNDQIASDMWGAQAAEIHRAYAVARQSVNAAMSYLKSLKSGVSNPTQKIALGLANEKINPATVAQTEPSAFTDDHYVNRMSRGVAKVKAESAAKK